MGRMGKFDCKGLKEFQNALEKMQDTRDEFVEGCAKELAARLLRMVVKRTPVGDYSHEVEVMAKRDSKNHKKGDVYKKKVNSSGKKGGTLRRGWTTQASGNGSEGLKTKGASQFADTLKVHHFGNTYVVEILNMTEYASYVEYGHRTRGHQGWVEGRFMMTISEQELERIAPKVLENRIKKYLEGYLK